MERQFFLCVFTLAAVTGLSQGQPAPTTLPRTPALPAATIVSGPPALEKGPAGVPVPDDGLGCGGAACEACQACQPCEPCQACEEGVCGPPGRFWVRGEYLLWWTKSSPLPPLLTTSPPGTPADQAGVLGLPTTSVLFGGSDVSANPRSGGRLTAGYWLDEQQTLGIEATGFALEERSRNFSATSNGVPILARPFFNAQTGREDSLLVAFPGLVRGTFTASAPDTELFGGEVYGRYNLCCCCCYRVDLLGGYRFLGMNEELGINETEIAVSSASGAPPGTRIDLGDHFETHNRFHGGELGIDAEFRHCRCYVDVTAKVALGSNRESVEILGNTSVNGTPPAPGGFLALPTNIGHFHRDHFAVVPEADVRFGYQVTDHMRAFVGYTFLYWDNVVRPGNQIDLTVNPSQLPPHTLVGPARPAFAFQQSDFWAQGLDFGLEFRY